jgi:hypothetical protein
MDSRNVSGQERKPNMRKELFGSTLLSVAFICTTAHAASIGRHYDPPVNLVLGDPGDFAIFGQPRVFDVNGHDLA